MKSARAATQKEPKTRRTREEGMQLLFDAAQKLLATNDPDDISIRDIAAIANVHHRFIAEWFGGKVGLFRAIHASQTLQISGLIAGSTTFGDRDNSTLRAVRREISLVNWLIVNGSKFDDVRDAFPSLIGAQNFLVKNFVISEEDAKKSSEIFGAIVAADAMLRPHIKTDSKPVDLIMHHLQTLQRKKDV
jgi:AcrR family transcriptional regulator